MKISKQTLHWGIPVILLLSTVFALIAWTDQPQHPATPQPANDTIPSKKKYQRDLDKEMEKLDRALEKIQHMGERDWNKIHDAIDESMAELDAKKIRLQTEKAIRLQLNAENIQRQVEEAIAKIDFDEIKENIMRGHEDLTDEEKQEIKEELEKAKKELKQHQREHKEKIKESIEKARHFDGEEVERAIQKAKEAAKESLKHEVLQEKMSHAMDKARHGIDEAKQTLKNYQEMIYDMEKAGLLDTQKDYSIAYRNGKLYINDQLQLPEVTEKYKKYFRDSAVTISKKNGDMSIEND